MATVGEERQHGVGVTDLVDRDGAAEGRVPVVVLRGRRPRADVRVGDGEVAVARGDAVVDLAGADADVEVLGLEATSLSAVYTDGSGVGRDEPLVVDAAAAATIADAFAAGDVALRSLAPDETPILWPEHFDIGISAGEVNYGVSAGDGYLEVPYAYVGPWSPPTQDDYWNAPFGRAVPVDEIDDLLAFFSEGRDRI